MNRRFYVLAAIAAASSLGFAAGCRPNAPDAGDASERAEGGEADELGEVGASGALDERIVDHGRALRTASLKLVDSPPTLDQITRVAFGSGQASAYEGEIDVMLGDPRFKERMIRWWRDTMRQGGEADASRPSRDSAPIFAARVVVEGRPFTDLFTAKSGTCPSYDAQAGAFKDGDCDNGVPVHAGVLTNPGVQSQFYSNMAFRRVRWIQEIFMCQKFPAETSGHPTSKGALEYVSPWPFESIAASPVNFQDTSSILCANCHTTMNHVAPLFAQFDSQGSWRGSIQVMTPASPSLVPTERSHWLAEGEVTAWRFGVPTPDLAALGAAIAQDPAVAECLAARLWNFAMSKGDIVTDLATVPPEVLAPYIAALRAPGGSLRGALRSMFLSGDFIRF